MAGEMGYNFCRSGEAMIEVFGVEGKELGYAKASEAEEVFSKVGSWLSQSLTTEDRRD
jgi:hypothetical protein